MVERVDRLPRRVGRREQRAPHHPARRDVEADLPQPPRAARVHQPHALLVEPLGDQAVARVEVVRRAQQPGRAVALDPEAVERSQRAPAADLPRLQRAGPAAARTEVLLRDRDHPSGQPHGVVVDAVVQRRPRASLGGAVHEPRTRRVAHVVGGGPPSPRDPGEPGRVDLHVVRARRPGGRASLEAAHEAGPRRIAQVDDVDAGRRAGQPGVAALVDAGRGVADAAAARHALPVEEPLHAARPGAVGRQRPRPGGVADVDHVEDAAPAAGVVGDEQDARAHVDVLVLGVGQVEPPDADGRAGGRDVEDRDPGQRGDVQMAVDRPGRDHALLGDRRLQPHARRALGRRRGAAREGEQDGHRHERSPHRTNATGGR